MRQGDAVLVRVVDGIVTVDVRGAIVGFHLAAARILGHSAAGAHGQNVSVLLPDPHRTQYGRDFAAYLHHGRSEVIGATREVEGLRRNG
jgi:PAS domain S-box-containing protein